ncbi:MAG: hypothetical protein ACRD9R_06455 [Pyrinomonadaceae bacterium]
MYARATIKGLTKRGAHTYQLTSAALAAIIFLSAMSAPALAQGGGKVSMNDFGVSFGMARGQKLRLSVFNSSLQDGSVRVVRGHIKIFSGSSGALLLNHELNNPPAGLHSFDINRDDLPEQGEPGTGRIQLWVEVEIVSRSTRRDEDPGAGVFPPNFELIAENSGTTILVGMLLPAVQRIR